MTFASHLLSIFQSLTSKLGVSWAQDKTQFTYLLDSVQGISYLSDDKLLMLRALLLQIIEKKKCTLKEIPPLLS